MIVSEFYCTEAAGTTVDNKQLCFCIDCEARGTALRDLIDLNSLNTSVDGVYNQISVNILSTYDEGIN